MPTLPGPALSARRRLVLAGGAALLAGCSAPRALDLLVARDTYRSQLSIAYGPEPRQQLDVYLPLQPAAAAPLVLFFYGGSWSRGARADYRFVGESLASAGIATLVADYRLSPQVRWTQILQDCAAATHWAFANAAQLGADPRRIHLMGHSAGAYNAAMLALDRRWLQAVQLAPGRLAGWIGIAGPYDFLPIQDPEAQVAFDWPHTPVASQPVAHAAAGAPPTLLIAGRRDTVVNTERSTLGLAQRLRAAGVPVQVRVFDELDHVRPMAALAGPLTSLAPVRQLVLEFVRTGPSAPPA